MLQYLTNCTEYSIDQRTGYLSQDRVRSLISESFIIQAHPLSFETANPIVIRVRLAHKRP
jgi:hypothetical protein